MWQQMASQEYLPSTNLWKGRKLKNSLGFAVPHKQSSLTSYHISNIPNILFY